MTPSLYQGVQLPPYDRTCQHIFRVLLVSHFDPGSDFWGDTTKMTDHCRRPGFYIHDILGVINKILRTVSTGSNMRYCANILPTRAF
jgi:hypothetical protein